jgi:hypothetical protein
LSCTINRIYAWEYFAEQQHFDLEKKLISSNSQLEAEKTSNTELQIKLSEIGKKWLLYQKLKVDVQSAENSFTENKIFLLWGLVSTVGKRVGPVIERSLV